MRLIDADALREEHCKECSADIQDGCKNDPVCASMMWVVEAPTVDAVPVVRCKDCKYMHTITEPSGKQHFHCRIAYGMPEVRETDFCNHGERKSDNE